MKNCSHFDARIISFLHQIEPILSNVNLELTISDISPNKYLDNLRIILANLLPLLNRIHSLSFNLRSLSNVKLTFGTENLTKLNVLEIYGSCTGLDEATQQAAVDFLLNWLTSPTGEDSICPKFCRAPVPFYNAFLDKITAAIRQVISIL